MITAINQEITPLTVFPDRTNYNSSSAYATAVAAWLNEEGIFSGQIDALVPKLETMISEINADVEAISNANDVLVGLANYKGDWLINYDDGSGYTLGDSVTYTDGETYIAKVDANIAEPTSKTTTESWYYLEKVTQDEMQTKQDILESGVNIKTINGEDIMGSGDLKTYRSLFEKSLFGGL